jgi:hypothetical protein
LLIARRKAVAGDLRQPDGNPSVAIKGDWHQ